MGCCCPHPPPDVGHVAGEAGSHLPRWDTCKDLDEKDRGTRVTIFIGPHHKVKLWASDDMPILAIKEKVEQELQAHPAFHKNVRFRVCKDIEYLMHRHQLPMYRALQASGHRGRHYTESMAKQTEEDSRRLTEKGVFKEIPDLNVHKLTGVLESIHLLAITKEFDVADYSRLAAEDAAQNGDYSFVDELGTQEKYWEKAGNFVLRVNREKFDTASGQWEDYDDTPALPPANEEDEEKEGHTDDDEVQLIIDEDEDTDHKDDSDVDDVELK